MKLPIQAGMLVCSVDVGAASGDESAIAGCVRAIVEEFSACNISATWAIAEAAACPVEPIASCGLPQELALLGQRSWCGSGVSRGHFARELSRRTAAAQSAGQSPATLVVRDGPAPVHLDLLIKQGIRAVRSDSAAACRTGSRPMLRIFGRALGEPIQPAVRSLRWGLWQIDGATRFNARRPARHRAQLDETARTLAILHLLIDAAQIAPAGRTAIKALATVLLHARQLCEGGGLSSLNIRDLAARLTQRCAPRPARSILRAAA